jgi:hypothetical protein
MKFYGEAPYASMEMRFDPLQHQLLVKLIKEKNIQYCIETGTYLGLGSTTNLARAFIESGVKVESFVTFEANHENYYKAVENLRKFPFIKPLMGSSMDQESIKNFIENDKPLLHPEHYPEVYSDFRPGQDPRPGYISESIGAGIIKPPEWNDNALLPYYLGSYTENKPLVVLDSAGGLGWLEFTTMMDIMEGSEFSLLLDDTEHVKHFRSLAYVRNTPEFELLATQNGWALATYKPFDS